VQQKILIGGRYSLGRLLGSGGMGIVYLARDESLGREVALKVLHAHHAGSGEFVERFAREAKSAASLSHPNIVEVYDFGQTGDEKSGDARGGTVGSFYMAMEYIAGGTLKGEIARHGALAPEAAAGATLQVSEALACAHEHGIVHRDVKPENVLLTVALVGTTTHADAIGYVKVADFGIAKAAEGPSVTQTSMILGTARYLSPEQARGGMVGPPSDLYSLGVVLFEALTGRVPFEAAEGGPIAIAMKHLTEEPPSPRELNPMVPKSLEAVTLRLLAKDPAERYASAEELSEDLGRVRDGHHPLFVGAGVPTKLSFATEPAQRKPSPVHPNVNPTIHLVRRKRRLRRSLVIGFCVATILTMSSLASGSFLSISPLVFGADVGTNAGATSLVETVRVPASGDTLAAPEAPTGQTPPPMRGTGEPHAPSSSEPSATISSASASSASAAAPASAASSTFAASSAAPAPVPKPTQDPTSDSPRAAENGPEQQTRAAAAVPATTAAEPASSAEPDSAPRTVKPSAPDPQGSEPAAPEIREPATPEPVEVQEVKVPKVEMP
jgi:serine/threonine-protein kinase